MKVKFYSRDNCSYCTMLRNLLEQKNIEYTEFKLNVDFTREELLQLFPSAKTFPVVIVDDRYIGGYDNFKLLLETCECDNCSCKG